MMGKPQWFQRWLEAFAIVTGRWSLHRSWQEGYDAGTKHEYHRLIVNGGWWGEVNARAERVSRERDRPTP